MHSNREMKINGIGLWHLDNCHADNVFTGNTVYFVGPEKSKPIALQPSFQSSDMQHRGEH
jgi:hypothetical protein